MGGQIAAAISALSDLAALHHAGKLRILATSGVQRSPVVPEIPTFRQQGFATVEAVGWHGMFAPARTPQLVIDQLSAAVSAALLSAVVRERMTTLGVLPTGTTPKGLSAIMEADTDHWRRIIKATGFSVE